MSNPTQCIDCEQRANKFRYDGVRDWCTLLQRDVTQSCYEHNTPADCPKRDENKTGGTEVSNQKKPRICEVLGVEVGEEFEIAAPFNCSVRIDEYGHLASSLDEHAIVVACVLTDIINHPEKIIRKRKFTPEEIELMRHIRSVFGDGVIYRSDDGTLCFEDDIFRYNLPRNTLLCIKPGDEMVDLKQVLKEEDQCH